MNNILNAKFAEVVSNHFKTPEIQEAYSLFVEYACYPSEKRYQLINALALRMKENQRTEDVVYQMYERLLEQEDDFEYSWANIFGDSIYLKSIASRKELRERYDSKNRL